LGPGQNQECPTHLLLWFLPRQDDEHRQLAPGLVRFDGKLRLDKYTAYADFCADLVRAINVEMGPDYAIDYWEVTNELDAIYSGTAGAAEVANIYNQAATKMRAVRNATGGFPTKNGQPLKIGAAGFANTFYDNAQNLNTFIHEFVRLTVGKVDFLSYHQYSTVTGSLSDAEHFSRAYSLGGATSRVRKSVDLLYGTTAKPALFHDEFNLLANASGATQASRESQGQMTGAIFDAIGLASIVKAKATGSMAWNEADGWYGKLGNDSNWTKRPGAYVYNLYNAHLRGSVANSTTAAPATIAIYPVQSSGKKAFALINQLPSSQTVRVTFTGTTPTNYTAYRITSSQPDPGTGFAVSSNSLSGGTLSLPATSITVFVQSGTTTTSSTPAQTTSTGTL
jgi:xylan 1,4-beta-xylosidase